MAMDLKGFRPMKAATFDDSESELAKLVYPFMASPKVDGIRCVIHPELGVVSNTLKPIPNNFIRKMLSYGVLNYLDGELVVGDPDNPKSFNQTQSGVMSQDGEPNFHFLVFDCFEAGSMCGYGIRLEDAKSKLAAHTGAWQHQVNMLEQRRIENYTELLEYEAEKVAQGFEGIVLRSLSGKYKFGRSTLRQQGMIKIKRFRDDEAIIIDYEPLERNDNEPTRDALGLQRRGYSQAGKIIDDSRVGRFRVRGVPGSRWSGVEFWIGSGLDDADRVRFREAIRTVEEGNIGLAHLPISSYPIGKTITFKYQEHGSIDAPRTPIWKGIRYDV